MTVLKLQSVLSFLQISMLVEDVAEPAVLLLVFYFWQGVPLSFFSTKGPVRSASCLPTT